MIALEIACNSFTSCLNASEGGADRIELFENIDCGGCTPSFGMIQKVKQSFTLPVYVMIRPRGGNFCYNEEEIAIMINDIQACLQLSVDGIVLGALDETGEIDTSNCQKLLSAWNYGHATFHRAIDRSNDLYKATEKIIDLGFERILTSGGKRLAVEGLATIRLLQERFGNEVEIMAGAGITAENASRIINYTKIKNIHATCRTTKLPGLKNINNEFEDLEKYSSASEIKALRKIINFC